MFAHCDEIKQDSLSLLYAVQRVLEKESASHPRWWPSLQVERSAMSFLYRRHLSLCLIAVLSLTVKGSSTLLAQSVSASHVVRLPCRSPSEPLALLFLRIQPMANCIAVHDILKMEPASSSHGSYHQRISALVQVFYKSELSQMWVFDVSARAS